MDFMEFPAIESVRWSQIARGMVSVILMDPVLVSGTLQERTVKFVRRNSMVLNVIYFVILPKLVMVMEYVHQKGFANVRLTLTELIVDIAHLDTMVNRAIHIVLIPLLAMAMVVATRMVVANAMT
eukprot:768777-Hanusia_phi.AAC.8